MELMASALGSAISVLVVAAIRGAFLFYGVMAGRVMGKGFTENPSWKKVVFLSMPIAAFIASVAGLWSYKLENPGETETEALFDALFVFFLVLVPLWTGCIWALVDLNNQNN